MIEFYNIFESCITFRLASRDEHQQSRSVPALVEVSVEFRWSILQESASWLEDVHALSLALFWVDLESYLGRIFDSVLYL